MKKTVVFLLLLVMLMLTGCQMAAPPQGTVPPAAPPELYVPRDVSFAYNLGTRSADGRPGPNYWQNHSVHDMRITVAPPSRTISATQEITFTNNSPYALSALVFKLIENVHRPDAMRAEIYPDGFLTDGIQINEFSVNGVAQAWGPDSGFVGIHVVPISPTLASKASVNFTISWQFELPDHIDHTKEGAVDDTTFFLAYFFPRIAVADDVNPTIWDLYEFAYGSLEMYNDFADFTVSVTAPKNFIVWATGDLQNPAEVLQADYAQRLQESMTSDEVINIAQPDELQQGLVTAQTDTVTWQWQANNVPDFVVALSDHYIWDAGSVVVDPATGRRASVQAAYDAPSEDFQQMVEFGKSALDFGSNEWPGVPYPYSKTTIFRGLADEEYPMFANDSSNEDPTFTRFVAAHELLHSWFPFYMGTNEQRYGFMDEGWVTAFEYLINVRDLGPEAATALFKQFRSKNLVTPFSGVDIPIITPSDSLQGDVIGRNNYEKAALGYLALKELMGDDLFKQVLHEFMARWNGKHPIPWDMFNTFNDASGQNYNWFYNNWFFEHNYLDIAVGAVQPTDGGYTVQVDNRGGMMMPFDLAVIYTDGSTESWRQSPAVWQASPESATITLDTAKTVVTLTLDGGIFMDATPPNNTWINPDATLEVPPTPEATATEPMTTTVEVTATTAPPTAELTQLRTTTWQWISYIGPVETYFIDNPAGYTLTFNDDATVNIVADCNNARGSYQGEGGNLTIEVGPMTRAACPPDSRSDQFVTFLGYAADYFFEEGHLHIDLFADGGTLVFAPVGATPEEAAIAMPNLADYPNLMEAGKFFGEKVMPTIMADCLALFSADAFPRAEPDYTGKQSRDLSAFEAALAGFTPERAAELDGLVLGKTIPELQALFTDGTLTSEELVVYYVDRIRRYDIDKLNSVLLLNPDALELARTLDAERAAGTVRGAMHGIPVLLKDNIATGDGMHTTAGAAALQTWAPDRDAFLVQQIRAAGGIIFGKANLSEWANYTDPCMPSGFSAVGGQTRNPYGAFDTLGSSSGSAASVAANLTTVSVGSETSGSLIQPARVQGIAALRPSQGLISRDYVVPLGAHLDTPGPMGRSLTDVAILLNAMIGVDANDPKTSDASALAGTDFTQFLDVERAKGLRVGVVMFEQTIAAQLDAVAQAGITIPADQMQSAIALWVEGNPIQAKAALEAQGITVVEIKQADLPPDVDTAQPQLIYGFGADLNSFLAGLAAPAPVSSIADVVAFNAEDMANRAPYNDRYVEWSATSELTAEEHAQIVAEAQAYANAWMNSLLTTYDVDVLIIGMRYAGNAGAAGVPALTIPAGLDASGKPTGIILTGPYLSEPDLFAVGYALEQAIQGRVEPDLDATIAQIEAVTGE